MLSFYLNSPTREIEEASFPLSKSFIFVSNIHFPQSSPIIPVNFKLVSGQTLGRTLLPPRNKQPYKWASMIEMWQARAENGDPDAQFQLGYNFENGQGTAADVTLAAKWYERAALQGHARAQYHLGLAYSNGVGVQWDLTEACKWLILAARRRLPEAEQMLNTLKAPANVRIEAAHRAKLFQKVEEPLIDAQEVPLPDREIPRIERQLGLDL